MRSNLIRLLVFVALAAACTAASAADAGVPTDSILSTVQDAMAVSAQQINQNVYKWLGAFLILQFTWTNVSQLLSGEADVQKAVGTLARSVSSGGLYVYLIQNGPGFIDAVGNQFIGTLPDTGEIMAATLGLCGGLVVGIATVGIVSSALANLLTYVTLGLFACGAYLALKVFMMQLELGIIVMLAPFNFSLLGLKALREQGMAPFKSLLAFIYRVILLTVIFKAFGLVVSNAGAAIKDVASMSWSDALQIGSAIKTVLYSVAAFPILAFLAFKSDSLASSLASGSSSMGVNDVAGAAAAGAAAGAAIASGGAAAIGAAGKAPKSMAGFMDNLAGGGGSVSNASPMGAGGDPPVFHAPEPALSSVGAPAGGSAAAPLPPSRPQSGAAPGQSKSNVASGRYGADMTDAEGIQRDAQNEPSAERNAGTDEAAGADAAATDPVTVTPASSQGGAAGEAKAVPRTDTPARSQGNAARTAKPAPEANVPAAASESALGAGIGGQTSQTSLEKDLTRLVDHLTTPKKPTLGERLGEANRHLAQEQATTHVSVSGHHHD
ncbi:hypothetical protein [Ralstonia condita]|nr:hypothetical protein [Ralstonia sp. LMG 7141]